MEITEFAMLMAEPGGVKALKTSHKLDPALDVAMVQLKTIV